MAAAEDLPKQPILGRLILTGQMPSDMIDSYKAAYSDHQKWLDEDNFSEEQGVIRDITITRNGEEWISVNFGPSEDFHRLIQYPHKYVVWMLTHGSWEQPSPPLVPWPVAILMNRLRQTNTHRFYNACVGPNRDLLEWNQETLHFSSAAWVCAHEWLVLEEAGDERQYVGSLYDSQESIMQGKEPEESESEDELVPFDNSASDVIRKHNFPLTLPSGHLNGVRSLPSCTQKKIKSLKTHRLCLSSVSGAKPILQKCSDNWPTPAVATQWRKIGNHDHIVMAEGRYTSAFSEMGVRAHRRLMAMADVALATSVDLKTG